MKIPYAVKRSLKSMRNLYIDPLPRNTTLVITEALLTDAGIDLVFHVDEERYVVSVTLPEILASKIDSLQDKALAPVLGAIAMSFAPYFFKLTDFQAVRMEAFPLDQASIEFFETFLLGGLGEFRYTQGLNPVRPVRLEVAEIVEPSPRPVVVEERAIMLNGGGKDSIVGAELLKRSEVPFTWLTINSNEVRRNVIALSGNDSALEIGFDISDKLRNAQVYPWGHFPHTSIVLAFGLLTAQLLGYSYVCVGNEYSASFGNVEFRGFDVNHQYSKSLEYERNFSDYVSRRLGDDVKVFSILRPFHDLQLAKIFSRFDSYFTSFVSCNVLIRRNEWCMKCSKCAFMVLALYPFIGKEGVTRIFGEDALERPEIRKHIYDLVADGIKPWECVGTVEENRLALRMLLDANPGREFSGEPSRHSLESQVSNVDVAGLSQRILESTESGHCLPPKLMRRLNGALEALGEPIIS